MAVLFLGLACRCPKSGQEASALKRYEFAEPQMGVPFRIVLYAPNFLAARTAADAAFDRVWTLNQIFSDYETDSELNQLCSRSGQGEPVPVSPDLWRVLERAQSLARRTEGAFDITVGPYSGLWRKARREKKLPDPARLLEAKERVGYEKLLLDHPHRTARLLVKNMHLDLGGIAKGYALDAALHVLRDHGLGRALVSGGGDMVLGDPPPDRPGWRIEVAPKDAPSAPPSRWLRLSNAAVATSGDLFQYLEVNNRRYSHIVDPRTGLGMTDQSLVTVIAPDGLTADSLATTLRVLGPKQGLPLIESFKKTAAYLVRQSGDTFETFESARFGRFEK